MIEESYDVEVQNVTREFYCFSNRNNKKTDQQ